MAKKKSKRTKYIYVEDTGTFGSDLLVAVGMSGDEIVKWMERKGLDKQLIKDFNEDHGGTHRNSNDGFVWHDEGRMVLSLSYWNPKDWNCHLILLHECVHVMQFELLGNKGMYSEYEAQAYQVEHLFEKIRKKLSSVW